MDEKIDLDKLDSSIDVCKQAIDDLITSLINSRRENGDKIVEGRRVEKNEFAWGRTTYEPETKEYHVGIYGTSIAVRTFKLINAIEHKKYIIGGSKYLARQISLNADTNTIDNKKLERVTKYCLLLEGLDPEIPPDKLDELLKLNTDGLWFPVVGKNFPNNDNDWIIPTCFVMSILMKRKSLYDNPLANAHEKLVKQSFNKELEIAQRALVVNTLKKLGTNIDIQIKDFLADFENSDKLSHTLNYDTSQDRKVFEIPSTFTMHVYLQNKGLLALENEFFLTKLNELIPQISKKGYHQDGYETKEIFSLTNLLHDVEIFLKQAKNANYQFDDVYFRQFPEDGADLSKGFVLLQVDVEGHSAWLKESTDKGQQGPKAIEARKILANNLIRELRGLHFHKLFWAGDGGVFVADERTRGDDIIDAAKKVFDVFKKWKGEEEYKQKLEIRVSADLAKDVWVYSNPGFWASDRLNWFVKHERDLARSGTLVLTSDLASSRRSFRVSLEQSKMDIPDKKNITIHKWYDK